MNARLVGGGHPAGPDVSSSRGGLKADDHFLRAAALTGAHQHPVHLGIGLELLLLDLDTTVSLSRTNGADEHAAAILVGDQNNFVKTSIGLSKGECIRVLHQWRDQPLGSITGGKGLNVTPALVE